MPLVTDWEVDDGEPLGPRRGAARWARWAMLFWVVVVLISLVVSIIQYAF